MVNHPSQKFHVLVYHKFRLICLKFLDLNVIQENINENLNGNITMIWDSFGFFYCSMSDYEKVYAVYISSSDKDFNIA